MKVKDLVNQHQTFVGKIYVYCEEVGYNLEFDMNNNDDEEILSNAEVIKHEFDNGALYIKIK